MLCLLICKRLEKKEKRKRKNFKPQVYKNIKLKGVVNEARVIWGGVLQKMRVIIK